jgi:mycothiol synthase
VAVDVFTALDGDLRNDVRALIKTVKVRDGAPPLSDHAMLQLGAVRPELKHLVDRRDATIAGYAQLDGDTAEIADGDGDSTAAVLLAALEEIAPRLIVWSHGKRSPVGPAAKARGYAKHRALWQLRRPLTDLPDKPLPEGVTVRPFVPGQDEDAWLAVNAAAFADHAEQGRFTKDDIEAREAESWFDPNGFLLAERDGELLGFHWTKVHPHRIGEVYVLGIAPQAQGLGLGPALLTAGLGYLAGQGQAEAMLYVDDSNTAAMELYRRYGFARHDLDAQYSRPS